MEQPLTPNALIEAAPLEILLEIASFLSPLDRASLGFASRHTYYANPQALKLDPLDRYIFLQRLEKDGLWLSQILCPTCRRFHYPRLDDRRGTLRGGIAARCNKSVAGMQLVHLPPQVHFMAVAAVARSHRFNSTVYGLDMLASHNKYSDGDAKLVFNVSARFWRGRILLKTETILHPGLDASTNVPKLQKLLEQNEHMARICPHEKWALSYPFLFCPSDHYGVAQGQTGSRAGYVASWRALHDFLWTHKDTPWVQLWGASRPGAALSQLRACLHCSTDYQISRVRLEVEGKPVKLLALTSWKDLGSGGDTDNPFWKEHAYRGIAAYGARTMPSWSVAVRFERREGHVSFFGHRYQPEIRENDDNW